MWDGDAVVRALRSSGVTHVVWLPDSDLGRWESALSGPDGLPLIRACREGEALAIAAGLFLGGQRPVVAMQCTGLFEAGDALRNLVHDLKLPLFVIVGVRSLIAHRAGQSNDSCPVFAEPIVQAWQIPYVLFDEKQRVDDLARVYREARDAGRAQLVLIAE